ncbi:MAG: hypothetical protein NC078_08550 [Ruminococcus sp.]|nr:hypothetical protein [Ruminococcus sp.]
MKKIFSLLVISIAMLMTACAAEEENATASDMQDTEISSAETDIQEETEQETTSEETTATETTTVETTTTETTTTEEPKLDSPWELNYFVDDFDRPTDDCYISGLFDGKFTNSATTNSELTTVFIISRYKENDGTITETVGIKLAEYGYSVVKNYGRRADCYNIQILEDNENIITEEGYMASEGDRILVWGDENQHSIINALKNNESLIFRIDEEDGMSSYIFTVDCTGFKELYESVDWNL